MKKLSEILGLDKLPSTTNNPQTEYVSGYVDGIQAVTNHINKFEIDYECLSKFVDECCSVYWDVDIRDQIKSKVPPEKLLKKKVG